LGGGTRAAHGFSRRFRHARLAFSPRISGAVYVPNGSRAIRDFAAISRTRRAAAATRVVVLLSLVTPLTLSSFQGAESARAARIHGCGAKGERARATPHAWGSGSRVKLRPFLRNVAGFLHPTPLFLSPPFFSPSPSGAVCSRLVTRSRAVTGGTPPDATHVVSLSYPPPHSSPTSGFGFI